MRPPAYPPRPARNKQFQQFAVRTNDAFERARREVEENGEEHVRRLAEMTHEKGVQPLRGFFRALRDEIKGVPPPRPPRR